MTGPIPTEAEEVVDFWLQAGTAAWFRHDPRFDTRFRNRYLESHEQAAGGQLDAWANSPPGALALLILLDQFPRNAFRQSARMFATDAKARAIADRAIKDGLDGSVSDHLRSFFYLPFEHSEDAADQARSLALFEPMGGEVLKFAKLHADIIERFGRFPHRNTVLGRVSTPEELAFLQSGGFAG